jgi:predicted Ser/Thr protein kinase
MGAVQPTVVLPFASMPSREEIAAAFPDLEVMEVLGQGGMGIVFKARQPRLDRLVALKILPPGLAQQPGFAERFTREARALAKLNHANIVTVHDFGISGGFFYLLMEYVNGVNLRKAMQAGIKPEQAMLLVPRICEALQFAHDHGVLHRDIKPENILLDTHGTPKLADFGIAKMAGEAPGSGLTLSGAALGTAAYMAPEQIEKPATVDHRADIYSLGVVFYEMLTGELPLGRFASPSEKSSVGESVDRVVMRALEKERDRRQQSATEMKTQVEGVRGGHAPVIPQMEQELHGPSPVKHFLRILTALCAIGIPASGALHIPHVTPQLMVFATMAAGVLAALWPSPPRTYYRTRRWPERRAAAEAGIFESRSRRLLFGMPLYHIVRGYNPATGIIPVARGIFAIGPVARGFFAIGGRAYGFIAIGGMATGVVTLGGISVGIFAAGGLAIGLLCAVGGMAVGTLVLGGGMAGVAYLAGEPDGHLLHGRMVLGPLVDPAGPLPQLLRRVAAVGGAASVLLSGLMLLLTSFAREGTLPLRNPWPRRCFFLILLLLAIPAVALFVPVWQARMAAGEGNTVHFTRTGSSSDGNRSEAIWEAKCDGPAWLTVNTGDGPQSIDLHRNGQGRYTATLSFQIEANKPQAGSARIAFSARNGHREISGISFQEIRPGVTVRNSLLIPRTDLSLSLSLSTVVPLLAGFDSVTATFSREPAMPLEDSATLQWRQVFDPVPESPGTKLTIDFTEHLQGDCITYFRTTGMDQPARTKTVQSYEGKYQEMQRCVWTLPASADDAARRGAVEAVRKALSQPGLKLFAGRDAPVLSLPLPDGKVAEIFIEARHRSSKNSDPALGADSGSAVSP